MTLHLKKGSPAFSPNNMRLGLEGMKKVVSNPPSKKAAKKKGDKVENQQQQLIDSFLQEGEKKEWHE